MNQSGYDLVTEQIKDKELLKLKEAIKSKYILLGNVLYYFSKADSDPVFQLYIHEHLKKEVIEQYHDNNGHNGNREDQQCNQNKVLLAKYVQEPISICNIFCNL